MNLGELAAWLDEHSNLPSNELPDEPFVVKYVIFDPEHREDNPGDFEEGDLFRFFISTRRLISASFNILVIIQTDATYKLLWEKYPVLLIGTSDANKKFFQLGVSVTTHERHFDFKFIFEGLDYGRNIFMVTFGS